MRNVWCVERNTTKNSCVLNVLVVARKMTVFVDAAIHYKGDKKYCHMVSVDLNELHDFADRLGVKRCWYSTKKNSPHYDITEEQRSKAIQTGALPATRRQVLQITRPNSNVLKRLDANQSQS